MADPGTELFATTADAKRRAAALSDRWNALQNQALGPGTVPRKDVPKKLQEQIISDRKRFRKFTRRVGFGYYGAIAPGILLTTDYEKLQQWYRKYRLRAKQLQDALPQDEELSKLAQPKKLPKRISPERYALELGGRLAAAAAVVAVLFSTVALIRGTRP